MSTSIPPREMPRGLIMCLYIGSLAAREGRQSDLDHFLRKRSNRTTSAPPWFGAAGSSVPSAGSVAGGTATPDGGGGGGKSSGGGGGATGGGERGGEFNGGSKEILVGPEGPNHPPRKAPKRK